MLVSEPRWHRPTCPTSELAEKLTVLCPGPSPARGLVRSLHPLSELALNAAWGLGHDFISPSAQDLFCSWRPLNVIFLFFSLSGIPDISVCGRTDPPLGGSGRQGRQRCRPTPGSCCPSPPTPLSVPAPVSTKQPADPYGTAWESRNDLGRQLRTLSRKSTERPWSESVNAVLWWRREAQTPQGKCQTERTGRAGTAGRVSPTTSRTSVWNPLSVYNFIGDAVLLWM